MLIEVPPSLIGKLFLHLFRLFMNNKVLCMGLYRAPGVNGSNNGSLLPYVFLSPQVRVGIVSVSVLVLYVYMCFVSMCIYTTHI